MKSVQHWTKTVISCIILSLMLLPLWASTHPAQSEITPEKALELLKEGNNRFVKDKMEHPRGDSDRRHETVKNGQHPYATILSCSDSRVPPEWIFDTGIGDLFIVRVAGNVADTDETGTIEYGTEHLRTPLLVVLGHSKCGAVTAVVNGDKVGGSIPALVDNIVPAAKRVASAKGASKADVDAVIHENVWQSIHDTLVNSAIVRELVEKGELKIVGAYYNLESGAVEWLGDYPGQETLLKSLGHKNKSFVLQIPWTGLIVCLLVLLLNFLFFVSENRLFKGIRIRGRLYAALIGLPLSVTLGYAYSDKGLQALVLFTVIGLTAVLIYGASILGSFRKVIQHYKGNTK